MYLRSRRTTTTASVRAGAAAAGLPCRRVPAPGQLGFRELHHLLPGCCQNRSHTLKKPASRSLLTSRNGRTDTKKPRGSTKRTSSSQKKVGTIHFDVLVSHFFCKSLLRMLYLQLFYAKSAKENPSRVFVGL